MPRARMLLVEDDASVRRFVAMALDDLEIELLQCESVSGAAALLDGQAFDLVLTDMSLLDGSALPLVEALATCPRVGKVAVFSAGVTPELSVRLGALGVWRVLHKPVSLAVLRDCVTSAAGPSLRQPSPSSESAGVARSAVDRFFGGDSVLFELYRGSCQQQFAQDLAAGDRACAARDLGSLRRMAHSLKTVLLMLGRDEGAELAAATDRAAATGSNDEATALWNRLRNHLC